MIAVLIYTKLSPYHIARLETTGAVGRHKGHQLVGVEIADTQHDYDWPETSEPGQSYRRFTLFPGSDYWTLPYARVGKALKQALTNVRPDVVALPGWGFKESVAGLAWSLRHGVPRVVISDSQPMDSAWALGKRWVKKFLLRRFQAAFVGGQPHVRYLKQLGFPPSQCFVGCDVVDNDFFSTESRRETQHGQGPDSGSSLLSCLRLLPRKNVLGVLDALAAQGQRWTWTIAGDGPQRAEIEQRVKTLGMEQRVHLLGHTDYFELPRLYVQADAYLQPSLYEPWGLAINEAMACGLPVVVSDRCGCCEDLVQEGGNGFTFDPARPESLALALDQLWEAKERWPEMGHASRGIIARWGLELFARNFWASCEVALSRVAETSRASVIDKALSLAL